MTLADQMRWSWTDAGASIEAVSPESSALFRADVTSRYPEQAGVEIVATAAY
jgi:hypothetical protein